MVKILFKKNSDYYVSTMYISLNISHIYIQDKTITPLFHEFYFSNNPE